MLPPTTPTHHYLDFDQKVKFPLLRLLHFLSDLFYCFKDRIETTNNNSYFFVGAISCTFQKKPQNNKI